MFVTQHTNLPRKRAAQKEQQMKDALLDATNAATAATASIAEISQIVAGLEARVTALEAASKASK